MLFNNMAYLPVKSGRQPNIERLQISLGRELWNIVDVIVGVGLIVSIFAGKKNYFK